MIKFNHKLMGAALACAVAVGFSAQVAGAEEHGWEKSIAVGFDLTDGNSETSLLKLNLDVQKKGDENEFIMGAEYSYGEATTGTPPVEDKTVDNSKVHGQYNRLFSDRLFGYLKAEWAQDTIADVKYRLIVGPGAGYYFLKDESTSLSGELGVSYVDEDVGGVTDDFFVLRIAERFEKQLSETSKIWQSAEYLPAIDDFGAYLLNAELGAEAAMNDKLSLRVVLQDKYDSEPAAGRDENDLALTAGVVYKL